MLDIDLLGLQVDACHALDAISTSTDCDVSWVHGTANTFLLLKLQFGDKSDIPEKYINTFCELTNTKRSYVNEWLPLVAAARLTKNKEEEKELLEQWINVVDFQ